VLTHGVLNAQQPEMSGLVLSLIDENKQAIPGFVSLADIYRLRAPELVVLSACDTALGESLDGEGLVGVTRGFMYAGASGVVASLWKVDDDSTTELMKSFYANMLQQGMSPAAALRDAQNKIRSQPKWRSPYFWAGFVFQGNDDLNIRAVPRTSVRSYQIIMAGGPVFILLLVILFWAWRRRLRTRS
jgi:CHAT domain-containing protein